MLPTRLQFLVPAIAVTLGLTSLCIITAQFLFRQQSAMTQVLRENVTSRRAAVDMEECLSDISALLHDNVDNVSSLNDRLTEHLRRLREVADQPEEQQASAKLDSGLRLYLQAWHKIPGRDNPVYEPAIAEALRALEQHLIQPCQQFRLYNGRRIEQSTQQHESILARLAWGMTGIGVLGGIAGIVLGFGITRALGRSIRKLQIRIRDTAGKLIQEPPEIILSEVGPFSQVHAELDQLSQGVERILSDLQQRELEVLRADQLAAVGQLAASVAHEIRNPLTAIKMLVQSAQEDGQSALNIEDLRVIETEIRRMESSLRTFLDFARPPKLERRQIRLKDLLRDVAGLVRGRCEKQRVELSISLTEDHTELMADAEQLRQVLVNLLLNALDVLPRGGRISLSAETFDNSVVIVIADTGPGISGAMRSRLFQPFSSTKETGLGLGLVISKRIVVDHGGTIEGENSNEGGARFTIRLPALTRE